MIRLAGSGAGTDYWISPSFTWTTGGFTMVFNHNKGKYIKGGVIYYPNSGPYPRYAHAILPRDASGVGADYGVMINGGVGNHTLNSVQLYFYEAYTAITQTNCVAYFEFLEPALPN